MHVDSAWEQWKPSAAEPWNLQRVIHLHRRARFGACWNEIQRDLGNSPAAAIDRVIAGESAGSGMTAAAFDHLADLIGESAVASEDLQRLKAWWLFRMLYSGHSLTERLTLMWHNHFATSNAKVADVRLMHEQNHLLRTAARGGFAQLLRSVVKHPAMLRWLDAESNRHQHPNENLARELMELFTIGEGHYSEADVRDAARSLTGWSIAGQPMARQQFRIIDAYHDVGPKCVLGRRGNFDGDDLLDVLIAHPETARRVAWRLCDEFLGENIASAGAIESLATILRDNDLTVDVAVETILRSRLFYSPQNIGSRIPAPAQFVVGSLRSLELLEPRPSTLDIAEHVETLGQNLFQPPNVFGWKGGRNWINTRTLLAREQFVSRLLSGGLHPAKGANLEQLPANNSIRRDRASWLLSLLLTGQDVSEKVKPNAHIAEVCKQILLLPAALVG